MSQGKPVPVVQLLSRALQRIRTTPPRIIASPPTQQRRAAVALIIRVVPPPFFLPPRGSPSPTLTQFFELEWVNDPGARVEILFLGRDGVYASDGMLGNLTKDTGLDEANIAFPGGRMEDGDEGGLYTAMRQTWEEIGLDLAERDFTCIGQLDDREITTSLGKRLLMILSPFVFLQLTPHAVPTEPSPGTTTHWTPLEALISAVLPGSVNNNNAFSSNWSSVTVDAASRLVPRHAAVLKVMVRVLIGSIQFPAILLDVPKFESYSSVSYAPTKATYLTFTQGTLEKGVPSKAQRSNSGEPRQLKLWGLSLGMTIDLISYMLLDHSAENPWEAVLQLPFHPVGGEGMRIDVVAPSLASVFPRFSYPDVNFWIWVFGKRYREVIRGWETSVVGGGTNDRRINWSGTALNNFYAAVRKALVVVVVLRAIGVTLVVLFTGWCVFT